MTSDRHFLALIVKALPLKCKMTYSGHLIVKVFGVPIGYFWSRKAERSVAESAFFEEEYYLSHMKGYLRGLTPAQHYIRYGSRDGVDPSPRFSNEFYIKAHALEKGRRLCPLLHYEMRTDSGAADLMEDYSRDEYLRQQIGADDFESARRLRASGRPVLLVSHELSRTGAPMALLELAKRLRTQGFAPMVASPCHGPVEKVLEDEGIPCRVSFLVSLKDDECSVGRNPFRDLARHFEVVVLSTMLASFWAKTFKAHGTKLMLWAHEGSCFLDYVRKRKCEGEVLNNLSLFDRIFCGGAYAGLTISRIANGTASPEILLYGIPDYALGRTPKTGDSTRVRCVVAGTIDERKAQDVLINALKTLSPAELSAFDIVIVGKPSSEDILRIVDRSGLSCVRRVGEMPLGDLVDLIAESDALLCPSRDDPLPIVVTYAMMFSKTVLVSDHTGTAALVKDGVSGFVVEAGSVNSLADGLRRLLSMRSSFPAIGARARKVYEENFTIDAFDNAIRRIFCLHR